jgi:hypothetical protein
MAPPPVANLQMTFHINGTRPRTVRGHASARCEFIDMEDGGPSRGRSRHLYTTLCIALVVLSSLHIKYTGVHR